MKKLFAAFIASVVLLTTSLVSAETFVEGKDYIRVPYPVPTRDESKIEVVELFWYGCGHCFKFEPMINKWAEKTADDVDFYHFPGDFGGWSTETQLHFTMEALGVLEKGRDLLFNEYHIVRNKLTSEKKRVAFFEMLGVSADDYSKAWNSFSVKSKVNQAQARTRSYRVTGVPAVIVNGIYRIDTRSGRTFERMLRIVDFLVDQERKAKQ